MRRVILPALLLLLVVMPSSGQPGRIGRPASRDARRTVERWYERYLGRPMDQYAAGWVAALQQGQSPEQLLAGILGSEEYYQRAGGTPSDFVRQLYEDVTGRRPSQQEVRHWVRQVYDRSRTDVAYAVLTRYAQDWDRDEREPPWRDRYDYRRPHNPYR